MHGKKGVLVFILLFVILIVKADEGVIVSHEVVKDRALVTDELVFSVTIENPRNVSDTFRFYSPLTFFEWIFRMEPSSISVDKRSSETIKLYLKPYDEKMGSGNYAVTLKLESNEYPNIVTEEVFNVEVLSYDDVIESELKLPSRIDSAEDNLFRVKLKNNYEGEIIVEDLTLVLKSDYFDERVENLTLWKDDIEEEFLVNFGDNIKVGDNDIHVLLYHKDKLVLDRVETIKIAASGDVTEVGTPEKGLFFFRDRIERINNQNAVSFESYTKRLSFFQKLFTDVSEEPTSITKEGGIYIYQWDFSLEPGEGKVILIDTDYRFFVYGLFGLLVLAWIVYMYLRKDISLTKKITFVRHSKDNISTIGVLLLVKNKGIGKIRNLKLMDGIGNVVEKPYNFGSLEPNRMFRSEKGTKLLWEVPVIDANSEIAISYTVKVKAKVIGKLPIPSAIAKYVKNKRRRLVVSNRVSMFS